MYLLFGYFIYITYYTIRQLLFNFHVKLNSPPFRWRLHKKTLQAIIADMTIVTGLCCLLDTGRISLLFFGVLIDILMLADTLYMRYYKNPLTVSVIYHNIRALKGAKESAFALFERKDLLYIADLPILCFYSFEMNRLTAQPFHNHIIGCAMIIIGSIWLAIVYYYSNRRPYKWNRKRIARDLGILFFHMADITRELINRLKRLRKLPEEQIQFIEKNFTTSSKNAFTNCCLNKNVLLIQMESMQDYLINLEIDGRDVTPNLNKLMKENIRFTNMYYQTSVANTSDAELLSNNALYPSAEKPSCYAYQTNDFYALGERLRQKGYTVKGFHGNQVSFWNRHLVYRQYGYQEFVDNSDMQNDEIYLLGLGDSSFFKQVLEKEADNLKRQKSFLFLITLSQHHPFTQFAEYDFPVGKYEGTTFGNYLKAAHYADKAIGELIRNLKDRKLYDDTLLFMYGDHAGIPELYWNQGSLNEKLAAANDNNWLREQKVAAVMHLPSDVQRNLTVPSSIDKITGQVDILPTLCNLLGLDDRYILGEDMLDKNPDSTAIFRDGTVIGQHFIHYAKEDYVYNERNQKIPMDDKTKELIKKAEIKLEASDLILDYNVIKILKKRYSFDNKEK